MVAKTIFLIFACFCFFYNCFETTQLDFHEDSSQLFGETANELLTLIKEFVNENPTTPITGNNQNLSAITSSEGGANDAERNPLQGYSRLLNEDHQNFSNVFQFHQSIICGMKLPANAKHSAYDISWTVYNFGFYRCADDKAEFDYFSGCYYGKNQIPQGNITQMIKETYQKGDSTFNKSEIGFCSQVSHKYMYSGARNDKHHIWELEEDYCSAYDGKYISAYYNHKFVVCDKEKFKLIGCLFDDIFVGVETLRKAQPDIPENHKDVCWHYGKKNNWIQSSLVLAGINDQKDSGVDIDYVHRMKRFHEEIICKLMKIEKVSYKFGWYYCINNQMRFQACLLNGKLVESQKIADMLRKKTGDYISNVEDVRFCSQLAREYAAVNDKSHEHENIWTAEDYACKEGLNGSKSVAYYNNFKLMLCNDRLYERPQLQGCLFDNRYFFKDQAERYMQNYPIISKPLASVHRDFCYEFGKKRNEIAPSVVAIREGHSEAGANLYTNCDFQPWSNGTVQYFISESAREFESKIETYIKLFQENTCLKFKRLMNPDANENYLNIQRISNTGLCTAAVGMHKGPQAFNMGNARCFPHEMGHALGFQHEHQRTIRDDWVKINYTDALYPYAYTTCESYHAFDFPFDYRSMMMYYEDRVMKRLFKYQDVREEISECDWAKINRLYECNPIQYKTTCTVSY